MQDIKIGNYPTSVFNGNELNNSKGAIEFGKVINDAINNVNNLEKDSNESVMALLQGKADVNETMIAIQKADLSMRMFLSVRNKVLDAYHEIMRMQF